MDETNRGHQQIHPVYNTYLNFYAAISYEFLGRAAHLYSRNKGALLRSSLDYFVGCGAALPAAIPLPKLTVDEASPALSPYKSSSRTPLLAEPYTIEERLMLFDPGEVGPPRGDSLMESITRIIDLSLANMDDDPYVSYSDTEPQTPFMRSLLKLAADTRKTTMKKRQLMLSPIKALESTTDPTKKDPLMPSPLRIRKVSNGPTEDGTKHADDNDSRSKASARPRPPPLPLKIIPASEFNVNRPKSSTIAILPKAKRVATPSDSETPSLTSSDETDSNDETATDISPARAAQIVRFNRGIDFLREQIKSSIAEIQPHVDHVEEIQRARRSRNMQRAVSFWSFSPVKNEERSGETQAQDPVMDQFGNILIKETKQQRIARLRAEGWTTVGLRSPRSTWKGARYYQEFCNMVLNELHLDN